MTHSPNNRQANSAGTTDSAEALVYHFRDDTIAAERAAAATVDLRWQKIVLSVTVVVILIALLLPHSHSVKGFDVLFSTAAASNGNLTMIDRIYAWIAVLGGVLLPIGTVVSRSMLVAWLNWFFSGIGTLLAFMAIWMRQSHTPDIASTGPSYGLLLATVTMAVIVATLSTLVFRRSVLQREVEALRRQQATQDDAVQLTQRRLRTGLDQAEQHVEPVDDRRARAKERARVAAERARDKA